jgi:hypothetical protein
MVTYYAKLPDMRFVRMDDDTAWEILNKQGDPKDTKPAYLALYEVSDVWEAAGEGAWRAQSGWAPCVWDWCRGLLNVEVSR